MTDEIRNVPPAQKIEFTVTVQDKGKINVKAIDRISIDDVTLHLINQEVFRILTGRDVVVPVSRNFRDFLVRERFRVR